MEVIYKEIIEEILSRKVLTEEEVNRIKALVCKRYGLDRIPSNSEILNFVSPDLREKFLRILKKKPVRTISGIAVVAVMAKPYPCPHGRCIYCPGGPNSVFGDVPQSYTGREPATMRALHNVFDPYAQVKNRLEQLKTIGHPIDKVELIIMGGTFPAYPLCYQEWFVRRCLDAMSNETTLTLEEAQNKAEKAAIRNVGITVETRPDYCKIDHVDRMLKMGVTRVELGVQTIYNYIYELVQRGHTVEDVVEATRILKDAGLKVTYHLMPGLPGSNFERDIRVFRRVFSDSRFKPDELKIYPTLVIPGTILYDMWQKGEYTPLTDEDVIRLLVEVKRKYIPRYVRIKRVMRDIPATVIAAGPKKGNLRELVWKELRKLGTRCYCIRCREVGHVMLKLGLEPDIENIKLKTMKYEASEGIELFLSYEDIKNDILIGFLRLRIPSEKAHRPEINEMPSAIVRELHVYGPLVQLGKTPERKEWQHRGYGKKLLREAERIAREEFDAKKILVTSGIGVREYYYSLGYRRDGAYVSKYLV